MINPLSPSNEPAFYFPPRTGKYDVSPGLTRLGTDFGNGDRDALLFQFDRDFARYRANTLAVRSHAHHRHVLRERFAAPVAATVVRFVAQQLAREHPAHFRLTEEASSGGAFTLHCHLTEETLLFDAEGHLSPSSLYGYDDAFDALSAQMQEDLAVVVRDSDGIADRIAALQVCAPSRWAPEEKIGRTFDATHAPVPGMEKVRAAAPGLVAAMVQRSPAAVRFTWGIEFDNRLNLHPSIASKERQARHGFAPDTLFLRVERQVIWGLPEVNAALFAIRVYLYDARPLRANPVQRDALAAALRSMSPESRAYKGLPPETFEAVIAWLGGDSVGAGGIAGR